MSLTTNALISQPVTGRDTQGADAANYFTMTTPTAGTGIITGNPTTLVATTPALVLFNGGALNVYLMYLRLSETVVGGGADTKNFIFFTLHVFLKIKIQFVLLQVLLVTSVQLLLLPLELIRDRFVMIGSVLH